MYGMRENPYGDPYRRSPAMDPYYRGGGYGGGFFLAEWCMDGSIMLPLLMAIILFVGVVLFIVSFSSPYWMTADGANLGLWRGCTPPLTAGGDEVCNSLVGENSYDLQWFTATQALQTIALVFILVSCVLIGYWFCSQARFFFVKALVLAMLFMAFIFAIVSVGIFGGNYDDETAFTGYGLEWAFYLSIVGSLFIILAACFLLCIPSVGGFPSFNFRDRFGFGYGPKPYGPPAPNPYGPNPAYGVYATGGANMYGSGLPYTARY